jgi:hypothetical protein
MCPAACRCRRVITGDNFTEVSARDGADSHVPDVPLSGSRLSPGDPVTIGSPGDPVTIGSPGDPVTIARRRRGAPPAGDGSRPPHTRKPKPTPQSQSPHNSRDDRRSVHMNTYEERCAKTVVDVVLTAAHTTTTRSTPDCAHAMLWIRFHLTCVFSRLCTGPRCDRDACGDASVAHAHNPRFG